MQTTQAKRDFMLIAHPAAPANAADGAFKSRFESAVQAARCAWPEIEWRAGFVLGPSDCVEVFSAPSLAEAGAVMAFVGKLGELRTEVVPLRSRW